jgi:AraC family transcriptional regulator
MQEVNMKAIESIQKVLEYIDNNYKDEITVSKLADVGNLSLFYFQRLFKDSVGISVEKYIILRRLAHSCTMLIENTLIKDAAIKCGFKSAEHFSRAFKELYGITPSKYKDTKMPLNHFFAPDVILKEIEVKLNEKYVSNEIVMNISVISRNETIVAGYEEECVNTIDKPGESGAAIAWDKFHKEKSNIKDRHVPYGEYGISHSFGRKGFKYLAGAAVDNIEKISSDIEQANVSDVITNLAVAIEQTNRTFTHLDLTILKSRHDILSSAEILRESLEYFNEFTRLISENPSLLLRSSPQAEIKER